MKRIVVAAIIGVISISLYGCSGKAKEEIEENKYEQTNNYNKEENIEEVDGIKDGYYEIEMVELMENKIKVNIIAEVIEKKANDDTSEADEVVKAMGVPGDDNNTKTISLNKKLRGKIKLGSSRAIARIRVKGGEIVEIIEI